ncbi:hypothetical protein OGAPHI_000193 [Ogataea philodendri]|uniref:Uncharacterized protein n=1 Tax=Ogataea philodendri TaxID=1378263 RepID=A0A9P8TA40_9ASCO|nr:uncharacterized protein OGAPHI_000193 [Ogataea philodendri]KAH3671491.1 hypothetical protein OGAPHI_000193 [Ogataea philodendri]
MLADMPTLNLPNFKIMNLILTGTTLAPQITPDIRHLDDGYTKRPLNLRCLDICVHMMDLLKADTQPMDDFFAPQLVSPDSDKQLRELMYQLFAFLKPIDQYRWTDIRDRSKPKSAQSSQTGNLRNGISLTNINTDDDKHDEQLLTNIHFNRLSTNFWDFLKWALNCASLQHQKPYFVSWRIWKNLIRLFVDFYWYDMESQNYIGNQQSDIQAIRSTYIYNAVLFLSGESIVTGFREVSKILFTSNKVSGPIFENELRVLKTAAIPEEIGAPKYDSIPLKSTIMNLLYNMAKRLDPDPDRYTSQLILEYGEKLIQLPTRELVELFSNACIQEEEMLLLLSLNLLEQIASNVDYGEPYSWFFKSPSIDESFLNFIVSEGPDIIERKSHKRLRQHIDHLELMNTLINFQLALWMRHNFESLSLDEKTATKDKILYSLKKMDENRQKSIEVTYKECKLQNILLEEDDKLYLEGKLFLPKLHDIYWIKFT